MRLSDLFARRTQGIRPGIEHVRGVFERLGRPSAAVPAIHIVGTNGKGTVAALTDHALRRRGHRVGRYTSPHLLRVNERITVQGAMVSDAELDTAVAQVVAAEPDGGARPLSFFEVLTLAALWVFERAAVDVLVVEAGLGGRLDTTRLVHPVATVVTAIGLDHQRFLGDTLRDIAREKAGVFVAGVPVFAGSQDPEASRVLRESARAAGSPWRTVTPLQRLPEGLHGDHQRGNAALALAAARVFDEQVHEGDLDGVAWPGRLERVRRGPGTVWFDVAHNPPAIAAMLAHLRPALGGAPPRVVFGCTSDRPVAKMLSEVATLGATWWVAVDDGTAHLGSALSGAARRFDSPTDAALLNALHERLEAGGHVVVCGSHRLVGPLREWALAGSVQLRVAATSDPTDPTDPRPSNGD